MKLSTELLFEKLQTEFTITAYGNLSSADGFLRPFLYDSKPLIDSRPIYEPLDKSKGITPGHVCLAHGKRLEEFIPHIFEEHFLVLTGTRDDVQKLSSAVFPYVVLSENTSLSSVLNFLQDIFDFYDDWSNELNTFLLKNDDITLLLHNALKIFQNPLSVISVDFSLIAETGEEKIPEKSRIFSDKEPNIDYINALTQDKTYQSFCNSPTPFFFPGYITGISTLTMNIFQNGVPTHRLILYEAQKPITRGEYCLLSHLAGYVEYLLYHQHIPISGQANDLHRILQTTLSDRSADYLDISHQLSSLGWNTRHEYLCLVYQTTYLDQKNMTTRAICNYMENHFPNCSSFLFKDEIVTFFNLSLLHAGSDEIASKLTYFIRDSFLKAGYSRAMTGHMNLRRQYVQAKTALDVGSRKKPYVWIHHFNNIALPYILEQCTRRLPASMICYENLLKLQALDQKQNSEYVLTLKTYLEQNLNATQTANELFIHRSTFLYRLEKIKSILDSNLDDPDEIFYLNLSLRLLEQDAEKN